MLICACMARFYITTAIVYTNASPHIGFALELLQADAIARYRRLIGDEVYFLTGTDEHGSKIDRSAKAAGKPAQEFVDGIAAKVGELAERLGISNTDFIRTTDRQRHWPAAQKIWRKMAESGDLYKKSYTGFYCIGHEAFIKPSELVDGRCPLHKTEPEKLEEENWFFRLSKYKEQVKKLIETDELRIVPASRKNEILNLLGDAEDVSFSRPSEQLQWGIPVPDDPSQTMYVWADALTNYISALGYGTDQGLMGFWPADIHLIGKDIVRFHAMIWPAMLISAGLATPKSIYVHGFINVDGEKMSKSLGNVIDPFEVIERYGPEVIRYFLLREIQSSEDGDFSYKNLESRYASDLANGLGNLVQRVATLIHTKEGGKIVYKADLSSTEASFTDVMDDTDYKTAFSMFRLHDAVGQVWQKIGLVNAFINDHQPWKEEGEPRTKTLTVAAGMIAHIAWLLEPFMPQTAAKVASIFGQPRPGDLSEGDEVAVNDFQPLFPRREA